MSALPSFAAGQGQSNNNAAHKLDNQCLGWGNNLNPTRQASITLLRCGVWHGLPLVVMCAAPQTTLYQSASPATPPSHSVSVGATHTAIEGEQSHRTTHQRTGCTHTINKHIATSACTPHWARRPMAAGSIMSCWAPCCTRARIRPAWLHLTRLPVAYESRQHSCQGRPATVLRKHKAPIQGSSSAEIWAQDAAADSRCRHAHLT